MINLALQHPFVSQFCCSPTVSSKTKG